MVSMSLRRRRTLCLVLVLLAATAGGAAMPASAEEDPHGVCTLIGCSNRLSLNLARQGDGVKVRDGVARLSFCVRDRCKRVGIKKWHGFWGVNVDCDSEITVRAVLTAKDSAGRRLARYSALVPLRANQPNGPNCPPTCFQGGVRFNGAALVIAS
jgi:hypothetical protein